VLGSQVNPSTVAQLPLPTARFFTPETVSLFGGGWRYASFQPALVGGFDVRKGITIFIRDACRMARLY
jgi:hypothetical protein